MILTQDGTQLISGGADSFIIIYDLVSSAAEFKLMGHTGGISQLQTVVTPHPLRGTPVKSLLSASVDGLIKVWDLQKQVCVGSYGEQQMTKINDFCLVAGLGLLVVGSNDRVLRVFEIKVKTDDTDK